MADEVEIVAAGYVGYYGVLSMACDIHMYRKRQHRSAWVKPWIVQRPVTIQ